MSADAVVSCGQASSVLHMREWSVVYEKEQRFLIRIARSAIGLQAPFPSVCFRSSSARCVVCASMARRGGTEVISSRSVWRNPRKSETCQ